MATLYGTVLEGTRRHEICLYLEMYYVDGSIRTSHMAFFPHVHQKESLREVA